jgi:hypothetical protein
MTNNEARERIAEIILNELWCSINKESALRAANKVLEAGYRQIDPKKLSVLSGCPCPDCEIFLHVIPSQLLEQAEIKRQKPCHSDCDKWRTWIDQSAQLAHTIKEIGE